MSITIHYFVDDEPVVMNNPECCNWIRNPLEQPLQGKTYVARMAYEADGFFLTDPDNPGVAKIRACQECCTPADGGGWREKP